MSKKCHLRLNFFKWPPLQCQNVLNYKINKLELSDMFLPSNDRHFEVDADAEKLVDTNNFKADCIDFITF